jgi:hypothetical protein
MPRSPHFPLFDLPNNICWWVHYEAPHCATSSTLPLLQWEPDISRFRTQLWNMKFWGKNAKLCETWGSHRSSCVGLWVVLSRGFVSRWPTLGAAYCPQL